MSEYKILKIAEDFYSIEQDFVRCFLLVGEKEGLLVDTGLGGNLKEYVEEITKLPIKVIFTHADGDHEGAAGQFEKCLMHPSEFDYYKSKNAGAVEMDPIWEGDTIDLGNYCLEVILIPGHTPGSIALLEREKRFLIGGDSIQTGSIFMFGNGRNFDAFRASMMKLQGLRECFDIVFASHGELTVKPDIVEQLFVVAGKVMKRKVEGKPQILHNRTVNCYELDGVSFFAE
jgi:hydroxyacylglutathione hydrolase